MTCMAEKNDYIYCITKQVHVHVNIRNMLTMPPVDRPVLSVHWKALRRTWRKMATRNINLRIIYVAGRYMDLI